ncbi:MAG: class I SAM-dependent methyltransferase [Deltaproteobacteria bacterium]|nr:class I SAM-dependent methyltransferase [Deltaproteobacteria bacterium]MBW2662574.1 class I SAM-dependent methyltransferase [Deltaproteobacteria bacterium]
MYCRFCHNELTHEFIDLVNAPPSNSFLTKDQLNEPEVFYPLKLMVCEKCWLVQIDEYKKSDDIFSEDYAYFSSYSKSWLDHARRYVNMIIDRLGLNSMSHVIEIASNDGYLLQYFKETQIACLGIEPSANTAQAAREKGVETLEAFFGTDLAERLAQEGGKADLIIGNNVLAHVPDINDFVAGLKVALKDNGVVTMEFPHLMRLIEQNQFDTIYHEHFSYYSLHTARRIFEKHGLEIFDVEQLPTHGGSLRIFARHHEDESKPVSSNIAALLGKEAARGMQKLDYYLDFQQKADKVKCTLLSFLLEQKKQGNIVAAYGAAAKGNTLLNYSGIKKDLISFVADVSPHKQDMFMPASHIPVVSEKNIEETRPDFVIILPWNIKNEIMDQLGYIREWDGKFVVAVPDLKIV